MRIQSPGRLRTGAPFGGPIATGWLTVGVALIRRPTSCQARSYSSSAAGWVSGIAVSSVFGSAVLRYSGAISDIAFGFMTTKPLSPPIACAGAEV